MPSTTLDAPICPVIEERRHLTMGNIEFTRLGQLITTKIMRPKGAARVYCILISVAYCVH